MAPHSLADSHDELVGAASAYRPEVNGTTSSYKSHLRKTSPEDLHDLICVGFGPASLAIAVNIHDSTAAGRLPAPGSASAPKVLFLEKQQRFSWHSGMLLPGSKMQISFIKDMASLRDPTSKFTFLNYLHQKGRLVEFTNLNTFLPARAEYEDYLRWCASFFDEVVQYGNEVVSVAPVAPTNPSNPAKIFVVTSRDTSSGKTKTYRAKNVLLAIGGQPLIPKGLPADHPRVVHSSQYAHVVPNILNRVDAPYRVAIIGGGQSAAEIFSNIQNLYPNSKTALIMRSEFLKPSDDSPFIPLTKNSVNSIFNPSYVDCLFPRSPEARQSMLEDARSTNYGVVRLQLIEQLYERMYDQRRDIGEDERKWPHRILGGTDIVAVDAQPDHLRLMVRPINSAPDAVGDYNQINTHNPASADEILEVDLVIAATGYQRQSHLTILEDVASLLPEARAANGPKSKVAEARVRDRVLKVSRNYSVQFAPGKVEQGSGVWLQGCCEGTHGLSDTLLSILATRSSEIVDSIFGLLPAKTNSLL
ncbi:L-lysine 6-monooxygenase (NADPH-requiring)-domain-containing protein [Biscogniauxia marginata]|nr:L-lysine 6-monooxygenase (NADPH-requiring)-domain-containing protein [Biscogniauxia marginata]